MNIYSGIDKRLMVKGAVLFAVFTCMMWSCKLFNYAELDGLPLLRDLKLNTEPDKTDYVINEELDLTGLEVISTWSNRTTRVEEIRPEEHIENHGTHTQTTGTKEVRITIGDKSVSFNIQVKVAPKTGKAITGISLAGANAAIDEKTKTIAIIVPPGTDVTVLAPEITVSAGASVTPASGAVQDFTEPIIYTVTAEDGSEQAYTVTVTIQGQRGIGIHFTESTDETINIAGEPAGMLSRSEPEDADREIRVTVSGTYSSYRWFVDGTEHTGQTGSSLILDAADFNVGTHRITVLVKTAEGVPYSKEVVFRITE